MTTKVNDKVIIMENSTTNLNLISSNLQQTGVAESMNGIATALP